MKITAPGPQKRAFKSSVGQGTLLLVMLTLAGVIFGQGSLSTAFAMPAPQVTTTLSGPETANIGDNITFTLTLKGDNLDLPNVGIHYGTQYDRDFVSASQVSGPGAFTCLNNVSTIDCDSTTTFPTGQEATFKFVFKINSNAYAGSYLYTEFQITGSYDLNTYTDGVTTHIPSKTALSIQGPARMLPGNNVTYTLVIKNNGSTPVNEVRLFNPVASNLTYISADNENCELRDADSLSHTKAINQGEPSPAGVYCELDNLAPGETKTVSLTFLANGNLGECFDNKATITLYAYPTFKGVNQGSMAGDVVSSTITTCFGNNNTPEPPADLIAQLRVSPDRVVTDSENTDITYSLTVKNIGYGKAHQVQAKLPYDPSLVIGYATFGQDGAWVSEISSDPANPYVVINFSDLDVNGTASATVVLRPSGTATAETTEFNRFTVKWDDAGGTGKSAGSNAVRLTLGSDNVNVNDGDVQLFNPAEITLAKDQVQTFTGDFFAPGELVTGWYTNASGESTWLETKMADATGTVCFDFSAKGHAAGEKFVLAAYGNRSGISGNSVITIGS